MAAAAISLGRIQRVRLSRRQSTPERPDQIRSFPDRSAYPARGETHLAARKIPESPCNRSRNGRLAICRLTVGRPGFI